MTGMTHYDYDIELGPVEDVEVRCPGSLPDQIRPFLVRGVEGFDEGLDGQLGSDLDRNQVCVQFIFYKTFANPEDTYDALNDDAAAREIIGQALPDLIDIKTELLKVVQRRMERMARQQTDDIVE